MDAFPTPSCALVITPHPDDAEGGCGGTISQWIKQGTAVYIVVCTDGGKGTSDLGMTPTRLASIRQKEQKEAAEVLGIRDVVFLAHPDGGLEDDYTFRGELVRAIRQFRPDVVLTTEPYRFNGHQHRDHRMAGQVTLDACFPYARDPLHFGEHIQEGLEPHKVGTVLFWNSADPELYIDITESLDLKIKALTQHVSQVGGRPTGQWIRSRAQEVGRLSGMLHAEAFRRIDFRR
ncbi:MAG: PIG-L family deacetylase [SAR202 cluster bacterium]|nr:PIG-L family deacetylase [SAR202 cluster bacterium]